MTETLLIAAVCFVVGAAIAAAFAVFALRARPAEPDESDAALAELSRQHVEATARLEAMMEVLRRGQSQFQHAVSEQLETVTHRVRQSMSATTEKTVEQLQSVHERLAVIDNAQKSISELTAGAQKNMAILTSQVSTLHNVLGNKQQRGAFGQARMEMIVQDGLPKGSYEFQSTLSNRSRPDCVVFLPDQRPLVIDAKFPLEAVTAYRDAQSEDERKQAAAKLRQDIGRHVADIAAKYLIAGETQDLALMFVPSESVYAELHDGFDDIVQKAFRSKVVIVSPSLLMLAIQVMQQIQKDARMREAADQIHAEVGNLMDDLKRMHERVLKLQGHFTQVNEDVRQIVISAEKVEKRGARIRDVEFASDEDRGPATIMPLTRRLEAGE